MVIGGGGDDTLGGGDGLDTLAFGVMEDGVEVDLRDGTSEGDGNDVLADFENVVGTTQADTIHADHGRSIVIGGRGSDELFGHDGADDLQGDQGNDQLFGQKGTDLVNGGPGRDQLDGGQAQRSLPRRTRSGRVRVLRGHPAQLRLTAGRTRHRSRRLAGGHQTSTRRPRTRDPSIGPKCRLSVELAGSSPSTQSSSGSESRDIGRPGGSRTSVTRLTSSKPGRSGCSSDDDVAEPRSATARVPIASAQSPGSSVGRIDGPAISTRNGRHRTKTKATARTAAEAATELPRSPSPVIGWRSRK